MFNKLLLISEGSPVFYGKARDTMEYFSSLSFVPEIPMNPAEFLLDLATGQVNDISVPQDIMKDQESTDPSAAVIKVRLVIIYLFHSQLNNNCFLYYVSMYNLSIKTYLSQKKKRIIKEQTHQNIFN
jgi:hypothetical protein